MHAMVRWNDQMSKVLNCVLAGVFGLLFLCAVPSFTAWATLLSGQNNSNQDVSQTEKGEVGVAGATAVELASESGACPEPPADSSWFSVTLGTVYNKFLLRPVPFSYWTFGQVLSGLLYTGVFMFCLLCHTSSIRENWRRAGCIAVAQLPWLFLFATKNNLLWLIGTSYEKVNWLHRLAGRLVILGGFLHATLFLHRAKHLQVHEREHLTGLICAVALVVLLLTSVGIFRHAFYQLFLISHVLGWITFVVALAFHVPHFARPYIFPSVALYSLDALVRVGKNRLGSATIEALPGGMTRVKCHVATSGWRAGQHVWLRTWRGAGWYRSWETHPFSIANAPAESSPLGCAHLSFGDHFLFQACSVRLESSTDTPLEGEHSQQDLRLLVKSTGAFTSALSRQSFRTETATTTIPCAFEGPYGGPGFLDFAECEAVLLVAGGSGITSPLPLLEELVHLASKGLARTRVVTLVWSVKAPEQVEWCRAVLTDLVLVALDKTQLELTVSLRVPRDLAVTSELAQTTVLATRIPHCMVSRSRLDMCALLRNHLEQLELRAKRDGQPRGGGLGIAVCGPRGLIRDARITVARTGSGASIKAGGVRFYSETFGW
ncbi:hypothetical protein JCM3774_002542 [Rhodotorula dairenensis]